MTRLALVLAAALLAACAGGGSRQARPSAAADLERSLARDAAAVQAGTVLEVRDDRLVLDPFEPALERVAVAVARSTPLFRHGEVISGSPREALLPGLDVKVFLSGGDGPPRVLGVKILSEPEARELRAAVARQPDLVESDSAVAEQYGGLSWQAGKVRRLSANAIVLQPYDRDAADTVLRVDGDFDVYVGAERVGREALRPGEDVRVYFDERTGTPRVLGVEILKDEEARRVREARR
jgi:hypothetical protein